MKTYINKKIKGSAIAYALVIIAVVGVILSSMVGFVASQIRYGRYVEEREKAFQVAEAGLYAYRWYLAHQTDGKSDDEIDAFWNGSPRGVGTPYTDDVATFEGGTVLGKYEVNVDKPTSGSSFAMVTVTGSTLKNPEIKRTIRARLRRSTWTDYAVLTDDPSRYDPLWDINGKIMSNKGVHFDGVAHNIVYSGVNDFIDPETGTLEQGVYTNWPKNPLTNAEYNDTLGSNVFLAGKRFPVVQKDFVGVALSFSAIKTFARNGISDNDCSSSGCYFDESGAGRYIVLKSNGTFDISTIESVKNNNDIKKIEPGTLHNFPIPNNGVIYVDNNVWVEGTITNKRVSIVSGGNTSRIFIGLGDLLYGEKNPQTVLGLISKTDIELTTEGPDDVKINASMLAQSGAVTKRDYNPNCCGGGCETNKNSINIFGSIASKKRIEFSVKKECNSEKSVGYQTKKLDYDNNVYYYPPPFFPSEVFYSIDLWEEL